MPRRESVTPLAAQQFSTATQQPSRFWDSRSLVLDPEMRSVKIQKTKKIQQNRDSYLVFDIPSAEDRRRDCWDLFTNDQETDWWAVNADSEAAEGYFIGRLNLERLGIKNRFFRRNETLKTVYIAKPERPA